MKSSLKLKAAVACLACAVLLAPAGVSAAGYENIGGTYRDGAIDWFWTIRQVTDPAAPGPEVAFIEYWESSPARLFLGTHDCNKGDAGPMFEQFINSWQPVAFYSSPTFFCLWSYGLGGSGSFNGDLAWD